jgi:hypothetical protein
MTLKKTPVPVTGTDGASAAHWAARSRRCHPEARVSVIAIPPGLGEMTGMAVATGQGDP